MKWECHQCGEQHESLPTQCRACGTAPEIVENVWRCPSCGTDAIAGTRITCPQCGASKGHDAAVAVAPDRRLEGPHAQALASGVWRYCAYCKTQVPPVDLRGQPNLRCPSCAGPLSESTESAARQTRSASEAATYQRQALATAPALGSAAQGLHTASAAPAASDRFVRRGSRVWLYCLAALVLLLPICIYVFVQPPPTVRLVVLDQTWTRTILIEERVAKTQEQWIGSVPADARNRVCERRKSFDRQVVDHEEEYFEEVEDRSRCQEERESQTTVDVADGEETYTTQEEDGKRCNSFGFETNGGVSVKKCLEWQPTYKTVTRTRPRTRKEVQTHRECVRYATRREKRIRPVFRQEPVFDDFCRYTVDVWTPLKSLVRSGSDVHPAWPDEPQLTSTQRIGGRVEQNVLRLKRLSKPLFITRGRRNSPACIDGPCELSLPESEWRRYSPGMHVRAKTLFGKIDHLLED